MACMGGRVGVKNFRGVFACGEGGGHKFEGWGVLLLRGLVPHYMPWSLGIEISVIEMHKIVAESFSRSVLGS